MAQAAAVAAPTAANTRINPIGAAAANALAADALDPYDVARDNPQEKVTRSLEKLLPARTADLPTADLCR